MNYAPSVVTCPYCRRQADLVDSSIVYQRSYGSLYICRPCDAYVGCVKGTTTPAGTLANRETRMWCRRAREAFEPLWTRKPPILTKRKAYVRLANLLQLPVEACRISYFQAPRCREIVRLMNLHYPDLAEKQAS